MTNLLDRRLRRLEASAKKTADGVETTRVVFVRPGEDADEKIAALGPLRPSNRDHLIVVCFKRPGDVRAPGEVLQ